MFRGRHTNRQVFVLDDLVIRMKNRAVFLVQDGCTFNLETIYALESNIPPSAERLWSLWTQEAVTKRQRGTRGHFLRFWDIEAKIRVGWTSLLVRLSTNKDQRIPKDQRKVQCRHVRKPFGTRVFHFAGPTTRLLDVPEIPRGGPQNWRKIPEPVVFVWTGRAMR